jgi:hypothetical protein
VERLRLVSITCLHVLCLAQGPLHALTCPTAAVYALACSLTDQPLHFARLKSLSRSLPCLGTLLYAWGAISGLITAPLGSGFACFLVACRAC